MSENVDTRLYAGIRRGMHVDMDCSVNGVNGVNGECEEAVS